jgi:hypothetical protein
MEEAYSNVYMDRSVTDRPFSSSSHGRATRLQTSHVPVPMRCKDPNEEQLLSAASASSVAMFIHGYLLQHGCTYGYPWRQAWRPLASFAQVRSNHALRHLRTILQLAEGDRNVKWAPAIALEARSTRPGSPSVGVVEPAHSALAISPPRHVQLQADGYRSTAGRFTILC